MRTKTTINLDDDLWKELKELATRDRVSFNEMFNQVLRAGLRASAALGVEDTLVEESDN